MSIARIYSEGNPVSPDGESWDKYIAFSGLTRLTEVVSLDGLLCPSLLPEIKDDYWPHIVNEDFMLQYFVDFDFLMKQVAGFELKNILCVGRNPTPLLNRHPRETSNS